MKTPPKARANGAINLTDFYGNIGVNMNKVPCKDGQSPCCLCGKPIEDGKAKYFIYENSGQEAVLPSEATKQDELVPIGTSCVKKYKVLKPFIVTKVGK